MIQDVPYLAKFAIAFLVGAMPSVASARPSNAAPFIGACGRGSHFYHLARFAITFLVGAGRELPALSICRWIQPTTRFS